MSRLKMNIYGFLHNMILFLWSMRRKSLQVTTLQAVTIMPCFLYMKIVNKNRTRDEHDHHDVLIYIG